MGGVSEHMSVLGSVRCERAQEEGSLAEEDAPPSDSPLRFLSSQRCSVAVIVFSSSRSTCFAYFFPLSHASHPCFDDSRD